MRTSKIVRSLSFDLNNKPKINTLKKKRIFYLLLSIFTIGLMYGSILIQSNSENIFPLLDIIQKTSTQNKTDSSFFYIMLNSLGSSVLFLLLIFLSGFSAIGQIVPCIVLFAKGLSLGSCVGYFYLTYQFKGLLYVIVIIIPSTLIILLALFLSAKESIRLSNLLFGTFLEKNTISFKTLKLYIIKNLILICFLLVSAILDGILSVLFAGIFKF